MSIKIKCDECKKSFFEGDVIISCVDCWRKKEFEIKNLTKKLVELQSKTKLFMRKERKLTHRR